MYIRSLSLCLSAGLVFAISASAFPALSYSTYLRDSFTPAAIATDAAGNIYLAGSAIVDPITSQTQVLVVKLNPQATAYLYVRYLGGSINDYASAIAVDSAGNAYVAGRTTSPDFPVAGGANLGTVPAPGGATERSFVLKLDPNGQLVFSDLLGGSANSYAQAVAVTATGQVVVSGNIAPSSPYLLELDPTGANLVFSTNGIGGSALAVDSSGNIYMSGTTGSLDYPTTPGTYQPSFPVFQTCTPPCTASFQGPNQYVTKVDPTGKMIFSTAVSGTGSTTNQGLAVDAAGNVYLTGLAGAGYPFTVTPPAVPTGPAMATLTTPALPFLSKLDPAGQNLLFSVPVGGAGVQVDSSGSVYVGGALGVLVPPGYDVAALIPALANIPAACLPNSTFIQKSAYAAQVDAASGNVLGSQFIGGSTLAISGVALSGSTLWIAGATNLPDFPFSSNALTIPSLGPNPLPGAYLGAVDFSQPQPPAGTPQIGCVLDAANLAPAGPTVPNQLLTIFGTGLGPATAATARDYSTTTLGGVSVSFGSLPAPLLYVSSTQVNLAVPLVPEGPFAASSIELTVGGVSSPPVEFPVAPAHPGLFLANPPTNPAINSGILVLALNADGSVNSFTNPAQMGSEISVFVNGLTPDPEVPNPFLQLYTPLLQLYTNAGWSVTKLSQLNPFVLDVALQVPSTALFFNCQPNIPACVAGFTLYDISPSGIFISGAYTLTFEGQFLSFAGEVYVTQAQ